MTITYDITHAIASTESVNVEVAEKSAFTLQQTTKDADGAVSTTYVLNSGDPIHPATVTYRSSIQSKNGKDTRRISVTFNTWAHSADSVSGLEVWEPIQNTFSIVVPLSLVVELVDLDDMIGNMFSFMYSGVTTGTRTTTYLSKLLFGVTQVV